jgi:hypothetical protein
MYSEILGVKQAELFEKLAIFKNDFFLAGGTALALQLGHRKSVDLDLFNYNDLQVEKIRRNLKKIGVNIDAVLINTVEEFTFLSSAVKVTFLTYLYNINSFLDYENGFRLADELSIAAMKAYAIGRRSKWKDYVDLYFLIKKYGINVVEDSAKIIFGSLFNNKLFREQLVYFKDVDFSEQVDFIPGFEITETEIKTYLKAVSVK